MGDPAMQLPFEDEDPAGTFRLTPEEVEELEAAEREGDEDEAAGRTRPIGEFLEELRQKLARS